MSSPDSNNCNCGHLKLEHILQVGSVTKWAFLGEGFFRTTQIGQGLCSKCMCPKYQQPRFLKSSKEYPPREKFEVSEERCGKCGRLLENHENVGHDFKR